jgi:hypothetical protein
LFELHILDVLSAEPDAVFSQQSMKTLKLQKAMRFIDRMYICSKREVFEHCVYGKSNQDFERLCLDLEYQYPSGTNFSGFEAHISKRWIEARSLGAPFTLGLYSRALVGTMLMYQKVRVGGIEAVFPALNLAGSIPDREKFAVLGIEYPFSKTSIQSAITELESFIRH